MENNIYLYNVESNTSSQVTSDGKANLHYNGIPDWVYEGELLVVHSYLNPYGQQWLKIRLDK